MCVCGGGGGGTKYDGTLGQQLAKALKILMTSSLSHVYDVIKQFSVSFEVEIRAPLYLFNLAEILHMDYFWGPDLEFELKNTIWARKRPFLSETYKFWPSPP